MKSFKVQTVNDLKEVSTFLIPLIKNRPVVAFYGKLGAGKTALIKVICAELQVKNKVTSPTFALVHEYMTMDGNLIFHFDFYRVNNIEEIYDLGYEEYFYSGNYCFIEWPDFAESILPADVLKIYITANQKKGRIIEISD